MFYCVSPTCYAINGIFFIVFPQDYKLFLWRGCLIILVTSVLDVEVDPDMPREQSMTVLKGNGPVPHHDEFGPGEPTTTGLYNNVGRKLCSSIGRRATSTE